MFCSTKPCDVTLITCTQAEAFETLETSRELSARMKPINQIFKYTSRCAGALWASFAHVSDDLASQQKNKKPATFALRVNSPSNAANL